MRSESLPPELSERFRRCVRYQRAHSWQKPFFDPGRFISNQLRKAGITRPELGSTAVTRTFHMPQFTVVNGENVSEFIVSYGIFEERLTEAFLRLIPRGEVVVDVGMHLGYYTTLFATLVGPKGSVHAFEPTPSTREIARRNTDQFPNIHVHPYAVWSSKGRIEFHDYGVKWMAFNSFSQTKPGQPVPDPKKIEVETIALDVFRESLDRKISFIKVDAETAEKEIMLGARRILTEDRPIVSLEVGDTPGKQEGRALIELMNSLGYIAWEFVSGNFVRHQPRARYDYDNLIFAHQSRHIG